MAGDVSYIETTITQLRDQPHAAWAALFYSCAPRFDYWLRHMPPNETVQHAAVFDRAMLQAAEQLGYVGMMHDPLTRRRFRLPARMRGCGIRSRAWLAPIALAGAPKHRQRFLSVRPGGWSRTPVNSSGTRLTLTLGLCIKPKQTLSLKTQL